jgi:hypothetical protein
MIGFLAQNGWGSRTTQDQTESKEKGKGERLKQDGKSDRGPRMSDQAGFKSPARTGSKVRSAPHKGASEWTIHLPVFDEEGRSARCGRGALNRHTPCDSWKNRPHPVSKERVGKPL